MSTTAELKALLAEAANIINLASSRDARFDNGLVARIDAVLSEREADREAEQEADVVWQNGAAGGFVSNIGPIYMYVNSLTHSWSWEVFQQEGIKDCEEAKKAASRAARHAARGLR